MDVTTWTVSARMGCSEGRNAGGEWCMGMIGGIAIGVGVGVGICDGGGGGGELMPVFMFLFSPLVTAFFGAFGDESGEGESEDFVVVVVVVVVVVLVVVGLVGYMPEMSLRTKLAGLLLDFAYSGWGGKIESGLDRTLWIV